VASSSSYYVPGPSSDYTITKKLESANQHTVTSEDKDIVLNADSGTSDQIGSGSHCRNVEEAFKSPVMMISEDILEPETKKKGSRKKGKKLTQICVK